MDLRSPRILAAWGLVSYTALWQFFAFLHWATPFAGPDFASRAAAAPFRDLFVNALPVLAVVLAVHVRPAIQGARLLVTVALVEYGVSLFLGGVTLLIGLGAVFDGMFRHAGPELNALDYLVLGTARLGLIAIAGYATLRALTTTSPAPEPRRS